MNEKCSPFLVILDSFLTKSEEKLAYLLKSCIQIYVQRLGFNYCMQGHKCMHLNVGVKAKHNFKFSFMAGRGDFAL